MGSSVMAAWERWWDDDGVRTLEQGVRLRRRSVSFSRLQRERGDGTG